MPVLGLGTAADPFPAPELVIKAVLEAIELGYRMFDTASVYGTEEALGEAISQALSLGFIKSREDVFIKMYLRWAYEQGVVIVMKSFNKDRLKQNLEIFDEESKKIAKIPQSRAYPAGMFISETGPIKSVEELWDGEI